MQNLGANDVYHWYMASLGLPPAFPSDLSSEQLPPDLKLNLIHPCTEKHVKKYSPQTIRVVNETPSIYQYVKPYILRQREEERLKWVYNILDGLEEQENIIHRYSNDLGKDPNGWLLLPDMNWDRVTISSLRVLGLVERRDLASLRDLKKRDVTWLRGVVNGMINEVVRQYEDKGIESDLLKVYLHCTSTLLLLQSSYQIHEGLNHKTRRGST